MVEGEEKRRRRLAVSHTAGFLPPATPARQRGEEPAIRIPNSVFAVALSRKSPACRFNRLDAQDKTGREVPDFEQMSCEK